MQPEEEGKELFDMFELPTQPVDVEQATEEPVLEPEHCLKQRRRNADHPQGSRGGGARTTIH
jgi:hypothetical protein